MESTVNRYGLESRIEKGHNEPVTVIIDYQKGRILNGYRDGEKAQAECDRLNYKHNNTAAERPVIYTITKRTAKWATVDIYTVSKEAIAYVTKVRYQPGASAGHDHECRTAYGNALAMDEPTKQRWEVREINPTL